MYEWGEIPERKLMMNPGKFGGEIKGPELTVRKWREDARFADARAGEKGRKGGGSSADAQRTKVCE